MKKVLFFYSLSWCQSSRAMYKVFTDIISSKSIKEVDFVLYDVDTESGTEMSCEYEVKNVPTTIFLENGKEINRVKGKISKNDLKEMIKKW